MRRIAGILLVVIGLALLAGTRYLTSLPASAFTGDVAPASLATTSITGYIIGLALCTFGLRAAFSRNSAGSLAVTARLTARTAVLRLVSFVLIVAVLLMGGYLVLTNGSPDTKQALMDALFSCRTRVHQFTSSPGGFAVSYPGTDDPINQMEAGTSLPTYSFQIQCGLDSYNVEYVELPAGQASTVSDPHGLLKDSLTALGTQDTVLSTSDTMLGNYPGLQFVVQEPSTSILSKTLTRYGTMYLVKDRLYIISVDSLSTAYSQTRAAQFVQSFKAS